MGVELDSTQQNGDPGAFSDQPTITDSQPVAAVTSLFDFDNFQKYAVTFLQTLPAPKKPSASHGNSGDKDTAPASQPNIEPVVRKEERKISVTHNQVELTLTKTASDLSVVTLNGPDHNLDNLLKFFKSMAEDRKEKSFEKIIFEITDPKHITPAHLMKLLNDIGYDRELMSFVEIRLPGAELALKTASDNEHAVERSSSDPKTSPNGAIESPMVDVNATTNTDSDSDSDVEVFERTGNPETPNDVVSAASSTPVHPIIQYTNNPVTLSEGPEPAPAPTPTSRDVTQTADTVTQPSSHSAPFANRPVTVREGPAPAQKRNPQCVSVEETINHGNRPSILNKLGGLCGKRPTDDEGPGISSNPPSPPKI